jgi:hypothetical protein
VGFYFFRLARRSRQHKVARSIAEYLENSNWKIERGPPAEGHGQFITPPRNE